MVPGLFFLYECAPQLSIIETEKRPLHFIFSYIQPDTQCYKQRTPREGPLQSLTM